jgi:tetratricopeptide (TPR) repeat protein
MQHTSVISDPQQLRARFRSAVALHQGGELLRARAAYEEVLKIQPRHSDALHLLGVILAQSNDPRAVELIEQSIEIDPHNAAANNNLGSALHGLGKFAAAIANYDKAIAIHADYADAYFNRGNAQRELGQWEAALLSYERAVSIRTDFAPAHFYRGNVLYQLAQLDAALESYRLAIVHGPDFAEAYSNRGNVLRKLGQYEAALASYDRAIAIKPDWAEAHFNRGVALNELKLPDAALASYDRAVAINPEFAEAHFNRSLVLLLKGDFDHGWTEHEWRWRNAFGSNINEKRAFSRPLWLGEESLAGRTILIFAEQGFGDTLQFCRYVKLVADLGARVIFEVPRPLAGLLASLEGVSQLVTRGDVLPDFDYQCPLMSLPLAFKTTPETIPRCRQYLKCDPTKAAQWEGRLGDNRVARIGLMWNGNPIQPNDHNRSFWLADLIPHLPPSFQYVSLQKYLREADRKTLESNPQVLNFAGELNDFADTAALCDRLDLVISICTSVAHLSAALGKKTWILLAFAADWRWQLDLDHSPWYPTARLLRQPRAGDWQGLFARLTRDLSAFSREPK